MNRKNAMTYLLALAVLFMLGCAAALLLREYDRRADDVQPLAQGRAVGFPLCGFSLTVPESAEVIDAGLPDGALLAASILLEGGALRFAAYENETHERIGALDAQQLVTQYTQAGAQDVRLRTLGSRLFIEYRAAPDGGSRRFSLWETWDEHIHLIFETEMAPRDALPILASIAP